MPVCLAVCTTCVNTIQVLTHMMRWSADAAFWAVGVNVCHSRRDDNLVIDNTGSFVARHWQQSDSSAPSHQPHMCMPCGPIA
jgi:hypothetical protein